MGWDDEIESGGASKVFAPVNDGGIQRLASDTARFQEVITMISQIQKKSRVTEGDKDRMKNLTADATNLARSLSTQTRARDPNANQRMFDKFSGDFQTTLAQYQKIQKKIASELKGEVAEARRRSSSYSQDQSDGIYTAQPVQDQTMDYGHAQAVTEEALIREKNQELAALEQDLVEVNSLMKDVAAMVGEQQEAIDTVESNVETAVVMAEKGNKELRTALKHQKKSRKRMCCLMIMILGIGIALAIVYGSK